MFYEYNLQTLWNGERIFSLCVKYLHWLQSYSKLFPPTDIIKIEDEGLYTKLYYEKVLNKLGPKQVYAELGENAVLLCYESWDTIKSGKVFCHRRIVSKWLEENLGVKVEEL